MVSLLNLSVCHLFLWTWGSQGQGQEQWPEPEQDFLALVACTPFPALVLFQGMNGKLKKIKKKKNSTPILENSWGLKALNQGNILPSLLWTPLSQGPSGPLPPTFSLVFPGTRLGRGKAPLLLAEVSLPKVSGLPLQPHLHQLVEPLKLTTVPFTHQLVSKVWS